MEGVGAKDEKGEGRLRRRERGRIGLDEGGRGEGRK